MLLPQLISNCIENTVPSSMMKDTKGIPMAIMEFQFQHFFFIFIFHNSILPFINNEFTSPFPTPSFFVNPWQSSNLLNRAHSLLILEKVIVTK